MADDSNAAPNLGADAEHAAGEAASAVESAGARIISDAEAEIKKLAQELHDKIGRLVADAHIGDLPYELSLAKQRVEEAARLVAEHFIKKDQLNG